MSLFEGYVGIRLGDGQQVDDLLFLLLLSLFILFALVFRANYRLFFKMMRNVGQVKERQNLFEEHVGNEWIFRTFMNFQTLLLCTTGLFSIARAGGYLRSFSERQLLYAYLLLLGAVWLFCCLRRGFYLLFGRVFAEREACRFWKTNYNAVVGAWGVVLYFPVVWLVLVGAGLPWAITCFAISYLCCRFVIIYKAIRIFYSKNGGPLYIILYLCGQEILPLLFMYKGVAYLYNFIEFSALWH